jgi:hypothetical protein
LAKIEAERLEQIKLKTIELIRNNEKSLLYTMEEVIYEEEKEEDESRNNKDIETDDEIEEDMDQFRKQSFADNKKELSESSDIPEEVNEEQDDEIPEALEYEEEEKNSK